jgi:hypothetical protein
VKNILLKIIIIKNLVKFFFLLKNDQNYLQYNMVLKTFYFHVFQYLQIWLNILMDDRHLNNHHKIGIKKCRFGLMFFSKKYLLFFFFFFDKI